MSFPACLERTVEPCTRPRCRRVTRPGMLSRLLSSTCFPRIDSSERPDGRGVAILPEGVTSGRGAMRTKGDKRCSRPDNRAFSPRPIALKKSDFHYDLPPDLIAQAPLPERSASRLLMADAASGRVEDRRFRELPDLLRAGDLLVFNDTRVLPARLFGRKETGGAVEILVERVLGTHEVRAQLGVSKKPKAGARILLADGSSASVLGRDG